MRWPRSRFDVIVRNNELTASGNTALGREGIDLKEGAGFDIGAFERQPRAAARAGRDRESGW